MINKEFRCESCQHEFVSLMPICTRCGAAATRVFLTAPRISTGVAKRTDRILESKFKQMGISNFSNAGGVNKVSWVSSGSTSTSVHGQPQPIIQAMFGGPEQLRKAGFNTAAMTKDGVPYSLPDPSQLAPMQLPEVGAKVGQFPSGLKEQTSTFAKTDDRGNVTELNGRDGK